MEREVKTTLWIEDGVLRVRAYISDFDGGHEKWQKSFYMLWRYQMTWDFAYEITVHEVHDGDVCVSMLIKESYKDQLLNTMEGLGYRNVRVEPEHVGIVQSYDITYGDKSVPEADEMFTVVLD